MTARGSEVVCPRCKKLTKVIVDHLCLACRAEVLGPGDDRETVPITVAVSESRLLNPIEGFMSCPSCEDPRGLAADSEGRLSEYEARGPLWTEDVEGKCPGCGALLCVTIDDDTSYVSVLDD